MLKFQLATLEDLKASACIERKRQMEEDRKLRIFNPRTRRIGVIILLFLLFFQISTILIFNFKFYLIRFSLNFSK